jgi:hypothetical protein
MLAANQALAAHMPAAAPRAQLPASVALPVSSAAPTHVLAVSSSAKGAAPGAPCVLVPTHSLLLLASCAALSPLPAAAAGAARVVPTGVPHPESFPALHAYLYARSAPALLGALLGLALPPSFAGPSDGARARAQLAGQLAQALLHGAAGEPARLMAGAKRVVGLWRNMCSLGVVDPELWDALDLAWDAVLAALNTVARR